MDFGRSQRLHEGHLIWSAPLREQPKAPEARMAFAADHQVVVDGDAERFGGRLDLARHLDVVARGLGIADGWLCTRMIQTLAT